MTLVRTFVLNCQFILVASISILPILTALDHILDHDFALPSLSTYTDMRAARRSELFLDIGEPAAGLSKYNLQQKRHICQLIHESAT